MKTGLCSITFRDLSISELARLVQHAELDAIEWGGDVHVPPGKLDAAQKARSITANLGLEVSSYGSYYSPFDKEGKPQDFIPILDSALTLGTNTLRIWAGKIGSALMTPAMRQALTDELRRVTEIAAEHHIRLGLEFHIDTLMDTQESAKQLLADVNHPNLFTYWQPPYWIPDQELRLNSLRQLQNRVLNAHVFHWTYSPAPGKSWHEAVDRRPLAEGSKEWKRYLHAFSQHGQYALLEFVRDNNPQQFLQDAAVLKQWVSESAES